MGRPLDVIEGDIDPKTADGVAQANKLFCPKSRLPELRS